MKQYLLFLCAGLILVLSACKDRNLQDMELIRKLRQRNTPDAVAADLTDAMKKGDVKSFFTLSTDRVRNATVNHYLLRDLGMTEDDALQIFSGELKNRFQSGELLPAKEKQETTDHAEYQFKTEQETVLIRLQCDQHGAWKNDTRF